MTDDERDAEISRLTREVEHWKRAENWAQARIIANENAYKRLRTENQVAFVLRYFYALPRWGEQECRVVDMLEKRLERAT